MYKRFVRYDDFLYNTMRCTTVSNCTVHILYCTKNLKSAICCTVQKSLYNSVSFCTTIFTVQWLGFYTVQPSFWTNPLCNTIGFYVNCNV